MNTSHFLFYTEKLLFLLASVLSMLMYTVSLTVIFHYFHCRRSSTCNHVAAVLFKIDAGWKLELSNLSCTSMECTWSAFAGKQAAEPRRLNEMKFCKPMYSKQGKY